MADKKLTDMVPLTEPEGAVVYGVKSGVDHQIMIGSMINQDDAPGDGRRYVRESRLWVRGGDVDSVNGKVGDVTISSSDIGAVSSTMVGVPNGIATLDIAGKLPTDQLPSINQARVIEVASEAERLALPAYASLTVARQTDTATTWALNANAAPGIPENWVFVAGDSVSGVLSFNARTGEVMPQSGDYTTDQITEVTKLFVTNAEKVSWSAKQEKLTSGANIKTINNESILGAGNIVVSGTGAAPVRTPVPLSPLTGTIDFPVDGTLIASNYAPLYSIDARDFREFQVDLISGDFSTPVIAHQTNSDSFVINPAILDDTEFKWRCRDKSVVGDYSEWSATQTFRTFDIYVVTPTIISPTPGGLLPERDEPIISSTFQIVNSSDSHYASVWTIKNDLGEVAYTTGRDTVNLTSWQPPLGVIVDGMTMTVEVYYESTSGFTSQAASSQFIGAAAAYGNYLSIAHNNSPRITVYGRDVDTFNKLTNPTSLPTSDSYSTKIGKSGKYVASATLNSPYLFVYKRVGDELVGIAPPTLSTTVNGIDFNSTESLMAVALTTSPFLRLYSISGDSFSLITGPTTLPTARANGVSISADNTYMAVCFEVSPYVLVYKDSGAGFENLAGALSQSPPNNSTGVSLSNDSRYLAVSHATAPYVTIYKRDGDVFTKLPDPVSLPTGTGRSVSFSSNANYLAVGHSTSPFITIYSRSGDTFTKVTNPTTLPPGQGNSVSFILNGDYLAVAHSTSPFVSIYKNVTGVFSKLSNPSNLPTGAGNACSFYPST